METKIKAEQRPVIMTGFSFICLLLLLLYPWKWAMCNTEAVQQYLHGIEKQKKYFVLRLFCPCNVF